MPRKQWRCFYCDEVFYSERRARIHFGSGSWGVESTPACKLTIAEGHLVDYIRRLEEENREHREETFSTLIAAYSMKMEAQSLVPDAEQRGYDKGVAETLDLVAEKLGIERSQIWAHMEEQI